MIPFRQSQAGAQEVHSVQPDKIQGQNRVNKFNHFLCKPKIFTMGIETHGSPQSNNTFHLLKQQKKQIMSTSYIKSVRFRLDKVQNGIVLIHCGSWQRWREAECLYSHEKLKEEDIQISACFWKNPLPTIHSYFS